VSSPEEVKLRLAVQRHAERVRELEARVAQLEAERGPFGVLMDKCLEKGLGDPATALSAWTADAVDLAERLGFRQPDFQKLFEGGRALRFGAGSFFITKASVSVGDWRDAHLELTLTLRSTGSHSPDVLARLREAGL
jgi:hypothetical protein